MRVSARTFTSVAAKDFPVIDGAAGEKMQAAITHFEEKGQRELPFVESQYKEIQQAKGSEAANTFLTGYTSDFAGATMQRWEDMADEFWKMFARGF